MRISCISYLFNKNKFCYMSSLRQFRERDYTVPRKKQLFRETSSKKNSIILFLIPSHIDNYNNI